MARRLSRIRPHTLRAMMAVLAAVVLLTNVSVADARAKPTPQELRKRLAVQQKQLNTLIVEYNKRREALAKARTAEKRARDQARGAQERYEQARLEVQQLATLRYQAPDLNVAVFGQSDPNAMLGQAALLQQVSDQQAARLEGFDELRHAYARTRDEAVQRTRDLRAALTEVAEDKRKAERLIEQIKDKLDRLATPKSRRRNGTWVPQLPGGSDNITPRMRGVRDVIKGRFPLSYSVGCYRSLQDGGEHPLGRACDFMLSSGGAMPSAGQVRLGGEIAAWAIKNAGRFGVMYVIYRQRIWQTVTGSWKPMSDRGGITANHFDHVHISVY